MENENVPLNGTGSQNPVNVPEGNPQKETSTDTNVTKPKKELFRKKKNTMCSKQSCVCKEKECDYLHKQYALKKWVYHLIIIVIILGIIVPFLEQTVLSLWCSEEKIGGIETWNQFVGIILGIVATILSIVSIIMSFKNYDDALSIQEKSLQTLNEVGKIAYDLTKMRDNIIQMVGDISKITNDIPKIIDDLSNLKREVAQIRTLHTKYLVNEASSETDWDDDPTSPRNTPPVPSSKKTRTPPKKKESTPNDQKRKNKNDK